jgi:2-polyprenyl-3-methyl-5-hydroxy-6-metoxy-1,4-benzoquinol methylase
MSTEDFRGPIGNASEKYAAGNPATAALLRRFLRQIDAAVGEIAPRSVLDVGCGEGIVTERIARELDDAPVVGIDAADARLKHEWTRRERENLSFVTGSAYSLDFEDDSFDLVCALEVLEHLERPRDALAEMVRVARGALLLSVPREPLWRISHLLAGRDIRSLGNTPGHINHWSRRSFRSLVAEFGRIASLSAPFPWTVAVVEIDQN